MTDSALDHKETSAAERFRAFVSSPENAAYGLKDNLLAVMTRDGSVTWQTVAAHIEAQLPAAGEFATIRLNAMLALIRTLSNRQPSEAG